MFPHGPEPTDKTPRKYVYKLAQLVPIANRAVTGADLERVINQATGNGSRFVGHVNYENRDFLVFERPTVQEVRYEEFPNVSDN